MKNSTEWSAWIIDYMQKNPVKTFNAAQAQIKHIVDLVQEDAVWTSENDSAQEIDTTPTGAA